MLHSGQRPFLKRFILLGKTIPYSVFSIFNHVFTSADVLTGVTHNGKLLGKAAEPRYSRGHRGPEQHHPDSSQGADQRQTPDLRWEVTPREKHQNRGQSNSCLLTISLLQNSLVPSIRFLFSIGWVLFQMMHFDNWMFQLILFLYVSGWVELLGFHSSADKVQTIQEEPSWAIQKCPAVQDKVCEQQQHAAGIHVQNRETDQVFLFHQHPERLHHWWSSEPGIRLAHRESTCHWRREYSAALFFHKTVWPLDFDAKNWKSQDCLMHFGSHLNFTFWSLLRSHKSRSDPNWSVPSWLLLVSKLHDSSIKPFVRLSAGTNIFPHWIKYFNGSIPHTILSAKFQLKTYLAFSQFVWWFASAEIHEAISRIKPFSQQLTLSLKVTPCKISGGLSGQMSWSKTRGEVHEETLTWSVDSLVKVDRKQTVVLSQFRSKKL